MKIFKYLVSAVLLSLFALAGCEKGPVEQTLLELDRTNMKMTVGQSQQLNAVLKGAEGDIVWESADEKLASVNEDGIVTALAAGTTKIVASAAGLTQECNLVIIDFTAAKLELNSEFKKDSETEYSHLILKGDKLHMDPKFYSADGEKVNELAYPKFTITASIPSRAGETVLTVNDEGLIEALNPGVVTVKVSGAGKEASVTLTVKSLELESAQMSMFVNQSNFLVATVLPESLPESERTVDWTSYSTDYVKVNSKGVVTALKATVANEPAVVVAECGDLTAECKITVTEYEIDAVVLSELEGLKTSDGSYQMLVGDKPYNLGVKFQKGGEDVTEMVKTLGVTVGYSSSNKEVATIESGIITVKAAGTTQIAVDCAGKKASFTLNVIQSVESLEIVSPENPYIVGVNASDFTIQYKVYPENASVKTVTFSSSAPEIASVNAKTGVVSVHKVGQVEITLTSDGLKRPSVNAQGETVSEPATTNLILVVSDEATKPTSLKITGQGVQDGQMTITKGKKAQLTPVVEPSSYAGTFVWSTTTPDVVSVDKNGMMQALARGTGNVVLVANGAVAELKVNVLGIDPTAIKIDQDYTTVSVSEKQILLTASVVAPENGDFGGANWYSSNESVASVNSDGQVEIHKQGKVTITAKALSSDGSHELSGVTASIELEFVAPTVSEVMVVLPQSMIQIGESIQLTYKTIPSEAEVHNVTWTMDDNNGLATITSSGVLTGKSCNLLTDSVTGRTSWESAVVKVTIDGVSATAQIPVIPRQPQDIVISLPPDNTLRVGQEWDFNPQILPSDLTGFTVGAYGATTNAYGLFSKGAPGSYTIGFYIAQSPNKVYEFQKSVSISVLPYWVESVSLPQTQELELGSSMYLTPAFTSDVEGVQPTYKDVMWQSSNPSVATVDKRTGEIIALSAGQTNITVTTTNSWAVPSGQAQKSATCVLTVKASEVSLNVGDYFYSDGTWSSQLQSGKTVVGIVYSKANAVVSDPQLAKDFPACTHGLVLGLTEYADQDFGAVSTYYGHKYYTELGYDASLIVNTEKPNGYGNSKAHKQLNASKPDYVSLFNAQSGIIATQTSAVATPANASSWYVPSYREMEMINDNYDKINAALNAAGGQPIVAPYERDESFDPMHSSDWYWTSTIYGVPYNTSYDHSKYAFDISKNAWTTYQQSSAKCKVRVVFAF